jgi:hypothetical protein
MKKGPTIAFRLIIYPLVGIIFLFISALMVVLASGYNIKLINGKIITEKTGIIIVSVRPGESTVKLDGELQERKTPSLSFFNMKIKRVPAGTHRLEVSHEGYETWENEVTVKSGLVTWRNYLILVPLERKSEPYNFAGNIESTVISEDQKRMVVFTADRVLNIYNTWLVNTENKVSTKIAEGTLVAGEKVELLEISNDYSKYLYKRVTLDKKFSFGVIEAKENGAKSDISSLFVNQAERYAFSPYDSRELYFYQAGGIYKLNLENKTESAVLARDVISFHSLQGDLFLVRKVEENYGLWSLSNNNELRNVIKVIPASTSYDVAYLKNKKLYVIRDAAGKDLMLYGNETKNPTLETIARNVHEFSISPDEEKILIHKNDQLEVYDLVEGIYFPAVSDVAPISMDWMQDSRNIIYRTKTEVRIVNYNGNYNKNIFPVSEVGLVLSPDNNYNVFYLNSTKGDKDLNSFSF